MVVKQLAGRFCPICKMPSVMKHSGMPGYLKCSSCGVVWAVKFKQARYESGYYKPGLSTAGVLFSPIQRLLYLLRQSYVGFRGKDLWVDVGAGDGEFLGALVAKRKIGVEISKAGREIMSREGIEVSTPRGFLGMKNVKADVISFWHVLEHVENPRELLAAAFKNLDRTGHLVVGVPNVDSWEFKIFGQKWFHFAPSYHRWHFSPESLKTLLSSEGFKVTRVDCWSPEHQLAGLVQSFINLTASSGNVLHKIVKRRENNTAIGFQDVASVIFWLTIGLPIILGFWIFAVVTRRPGTIVVVAGWR